MSRACSTLKKNINQTMRQTQQHVDFQSLNEDVQILILTYCELPDLYHFALTGSFGAYLVLSKETDEFLWGSIAETMNIDENEPAISWLSTGALEPQQKNKGVKYLLPLRSSSNKENKSSLKQRLTSFFFGGKKTKQKSKQEPAVIQQETLSSDTVAETVDEEAERALPAAIDTAAELDKQEENAWRVRVRNGHQFRWDPESRQPDTTLVLSNFNRSVSNNRSSKWDTCRACVPLRTGYKHTWEYHLDNYEDHSSGNSFKVFVGIEKSTYDFNVIGFDKIIGWNSTGIGYNLGMTSLHRNNNHSTDAMFMNPSITAGFTTGDRITLRLDLENIDNNKKQGKLEFFKNGVWFLTVDDVDTVESSGKPILWYPAISLICIQTVTLRRGTAFKRLDY
jgi:hypothetical protein